ncbi:MAG: prephenate dehydratase [bacterium]
MDIQTFRNEIDNVDTQILELLNKRAQAAIEIGKIKRKENKEIYVPKREEEIFEKLEGINKGPFPNKAIRLVFKEIMSASLSLEQPLRVAYFGPQATFTHLACMKKFGLSGDFVPVKFISDVFAEVERDRVDYGVVPIENSTEGIVNHTLDMFIDSNLKICSEIILEISQNLLSKTGNIGDIKKVYSHQQPIAQCKTWIKENLPDIPIIEVSSTARAAEMAAEDISAAAIASDLASKVYDLKIIKSRIEDNINNYTRFLVIGQKLGEKGRYNKTSIMFSVKDRVGVLYDILGLFASHKINLTKIESRPSRKKAWEYIFFSDLEGHFEEPNIKKAIEELGEKCIFVKVLGAYPIEKNKN